MKKNGMIIAGVMKQRRRMASKIAIMFRQNETTVEGNTLSIQFTSYVNTTKLLDKETCAKTHQTIQKDRKEERIEKTEKRRNSTQSVSVKFYVYFENPI
jgi:hypothetical protein